MTLQYLYRGSEALAFAEWSLHVCADGSYIKDKKQAMPGYLSMVNAMSYGKELGHQ